MANEPSVHGPLAVKAAVTAPPASRMPAPHSDVVQVLPAGNGVAVDCSSASNCAGVSAGFTDSMSEATPTTCGVAMLVPWYRA